MRFIIVRNYKILLIIPPGPKNDICAFGLREKQSKKLSNLHSPINGLEPGSHEKVREPISNRVRPKEIFEQNRCAIGWSDIYDLSTNPVNRISVSAPTIFADFASARLRNHEIGSAAKCIGTVVHLLASPTQGLCSNPGHQSKRHHVPLR